MEGGRSCCQAMHGDTGDMGGTRCGAGAQCWDKALLTWARLAQSSRERATLSRLHLEWKLKSAVK